MKKKEKVSEVSHTRAVIDGQQIEIDYMTPFKHERAFDCLCLFYVSGPGAGAMYRAHLDREVADLPSHDLLRWLLEHLTETRRIKLVRSFSLSS